MARIWNIVVAGFDRTIGKAMATYLPEPLQKIVIKWKGGTSFYDVTARHSISDVEIREILDRSHADYLNPCLKDLWTQNPKLRIYMDGRVGDEPETSDVTEKYGTAGEAILGDRYCRIGESF